MTTLDEIVRELTHAGGLAYFAGERYTVQTANEALAQLGAKLLPDVPLSKAKTALYRHYASDGSLLYVGVSLHTALRLIGHKASADWLYLLARIDVEWFPDRKTAEAAERKAIKTEKPIHNIAFNHVPAIRNKRRRKRNV